MKSKKSSKPDIDIKNKYYYTSLGLVLGIAVGLMWGMMFEVNALGLVFGAFAGLLIGYSLDNRRR